MFISDAMAQTTNEAPSVIGIGSMWLPVLVVFLIFFFFIILPKNKKQNQKFEKLRTLQRGDKVITTSGIYGKVKKMPQDQIVVLEIAKDVEIRIKKIKIAEVL